MENQIVCPNCKRTLTNLPIINDAAKGEGSDKQSVVCECGEKLSYWKITALLREQKTFGSRVQKWMRSLTHSKG